MTARTTPQAPGTPVWLDLWSRRPEETAGLLGRLMGYQAPEGPPELGGYRVARRDGLPVLGIGPLADGQGPDQAALYLATDDLDATVARARELGAEVVVGPHEVPGSGRFAAVRDGGGVVTSLWQGREMLGYGAVDEPGFPCWQDCLSGDVTATARLLGGLFGFDTSERMGEDVLLARLGEDAHFTIGPVGPDAPPHWVSYLLVGDVDEATSRAELLGARRTMGPQDLPFGRFAHLLTPGGAPFGLFSAHPQAGRPDPEP